MEPTRLKRELGLGGAIVTGLGSIIGTGAFVAIGIASGLWGSAVLVAVPLAALVAVFNGLSSAFLAGRFPVAGGTYEYGYETLGSALGFTAGWLFILAKTASAATAALGVTLYLGLADARVPVAVGVVGLMTLLVLLGLRRTTFANTVLVATSVGALVAFTIAGLQEAAAAGAIAAPVASAGSGLLPATAFLFVSYTGYGRIATLGEEVSQPERTIPVAVVVTLAIAAALYMGVAVAGDALGGPRWGAPLSTGSSLASFVPRPVSTVVAIGAFAALVGVILNLVLGLSRVWLAMGRRHDMPMALARLDERSVPRSAVLATGATIAAVALVGDIRLAWSFSAFSVLLYYGITNLAALRLDRSRASSWAGLGSCVFLSLFVPMEVWLTGIGLVGLGLVWHRQRRS